MNTHHLELFFYVAKHQGVSAAARHIGAPAAIQHSYLPRLLKALQRRFAKMEFSLVTGWQNDFEARLLADELDLAVTSLFGKPATGLRFQDLLSLPLALLVSEKSRLKSADDLWKKDRIDEPLICLEAMDPMCRNFQHDLQRRKIEWYPTLELASMELVAEYASKGFGVEAPRRSLKNSDDYWLNPEYEFQASGFEFSKSERYMRLPEHSKSVGHFGRNVSGFST
ncbi:MAG: substrate-binding domain-containing protein [Verrucomicrobia bacterium]|nr:substrate-binding domain-containing protein [Verrucomicrobiota bacterium]